MPQCEEQPWAHRHSDAVRRGTSGDNAYPMSPTSLAIVRS
jgi:hypothetical protein